MSCYQSVSMREAEHMLHDGDLLVLDMRDYKSYCADHYPRALHLDDKNLRILLKHTNRQVPIMIYCDHGHRSQEMVRLFMDFGFRNCFSLEGGYEGWFQDCTAPKFSLSPHLCAWLSDNGFSKNNLDLRCANNNTALMLAARLGAWEFCEEMIAAGCSINLVNQDGNNALWMACENGDKHTINRLLNAGIDINNQNDNGATALMYAASRGNKDIVDRLAHAGADISLKTHDDFTVMDVVSTPGIYHFIKSLAAGITRSAAGHRSYA